MQAESFFTSGNCPAPASTITSAPITSAPITSAPITPSLEQFLDQVRSEGYRVEHQAAWPNGAGWIALAQQVDGESRVNLMVNYYPDHTYTSHAV